MPTLHVIRSSDASLFPLDSLEQKKRPTVSLQDSEDLVSGNEFDLGNTVRVSEDDTDLRRRKTPLGEFEDLVRDILGGCL